jgi:hypothetical protein
MRGNRTPYRPLWEQLLSNKETPCNLNTKRLTNYNKLQRMSLIIRAVIPRGVAADEEFLGDMAATDSAR